MHAPEVPASRIQEAEDRYGQPLEAAVRQPLLAWELDLIERVCGDVRFHDLTAFVLRDDRLALVHKPSDRPGVYWAPAGGLAGDEELAAGVRREVWEETGLEVEVERYVLRLRASFEVDRRARPWVSHVFLARWMGGELDPVDTREVETAAWVPVRRFQQEIAPLFTAAGWGRYAYRLHMASLVLPLLGFDPAPTDGVGPEAPLE